MSKPASFIIPAGLVFEQGDDGLSIEHQGDVILHSTLGLPLKRVRSAEGDIELHVNADNLSELSAGGTVRVHGAVTATRINADRIEIHGDTQVNYIEAGAGGISITGSATAHEISSGGNIEVTGEAKADTLSASGDVTIGGTSKIDFLSTDNGNIHLSGVAAKAIASGGDLIITGDLEVEEATATSGLLQTQGNVSARLLRAEAVELSGPEATVSAIQGISRIAVGTGKIKSDILIAPSIDIASEATGKITVLETHNDPGPNSVKGCLGLTDLEEFGVDTANYLSDRKLSPLGESVPEPVIETDTEDEPTNAEEPAIETVADDDEEFSIEAIAIETLDDDMADLTLEDESPEHAPFSLVAELADEEPELEEVWLGALELSPLEEDDENSISEIFDLATEPTGSEEDPLYEQLRETIAQIEACYEGSELPPAVNQLGKLANDRNYVAIRDDITNIWHQLLKFHQKRGLRIQPQVTTTFNMINTLVRKI